MEPLMLHSLTINDLNFIGEGNEHLVFGIANSDRVLRFRKVLPGDVISREEFMLRVRDDLQFINGVAGPLAGPLLTDEASFVVVDPSVLKKVMKGIEELRNANRLHKVINPFGFGILTPNGATKFVNRRHRPQTEGVTIVNVVQGVNSSVALSQSILPITSNTKDHSLVTIRPSSAETSSKDSSKASTDSQNGFGHLTSEGLRKKQNATCQMKSFCVELKPKQGFLEPYGSGGNTLCRFCVKQYLKVKNKVESSRSAYCPLDLYSGDENLMRRALRRLFSSPQQNLKIFSNGSVVPDHNVYSYISDLIVRILNYDLEKKLTEKQSLEPQLISKLTNEVSQSSNNDIPPLRLVSSSESLNHLSDTKLHPVNSELKSKNSDTCALKSKSQSLILESQAVNSKSQTLNLESQATNCESQATNFESQASTFESPIKRLSPVTNTSNSLHNQPESTNITCERLEKNKQFKLPRYSYFPTNSSLSPSTILGRVLQLQSFGRISELQAALFYKELTKRLGSKDVLNQLLSNFKFLNDTVLLENATTETKEDETMSPSSLEDSGLLWDGPIDLVDTSYLIQLVQQALVAMSFKDVSLMIYIEGPTKTVPLELEAESPFWMEHPPGCGEWYQCQVTLVDLAHKCSKKILDHETALKELEEILTLLKAECKEPLCCRSKGEKRKL